MRRFSNRNAMRNIAQASNVAADGWRLWISIRSKWISYHQLSTFRITYRISRPTRAIIEGSGLWLTMQCHYDMQTLRHASFFLSLPSRALWCRVGFFSFATLPENVQSLKITAFSPPWKLSVESPDASGELVNSKRLLKRHCHRTMSFLHKEATWTMTGHSFAIR